MKKLCARVMIGFLGISTALAAGDGRIEISQLDMAAPPYVITNSGSYVLTENLTVSAPGASGIEILASDVTLDLNGFVITGPGTDSGNYGIYGTNNVENLTLKNGTVRNWRSPFSVAIDLDGPYARLKNITARDCGGGILVGIGSEIASCLSTGHTNSQVTGISAGQGSHIRDCTVEYCRSLVVSCIGIEVSGTDGKLTRCIVENCHSEAGLFAGIGAGTDATLSDSTVQAVSGSSSAMAFSADRAIITGCAANNITCTNGWIWAFSVNEACVIKACTSSYLMSSNAVGFDILKGCLVEDCTVRYLGGFAGPTSANIYGIRAGQDNVVRGCVFSENRGYGIRVTGTGNRIEANSSTENDLHGINVESGNNLIIKNSARANGGSGGVPDNDYDFNGNTVTYGPIISATGVITNMNPWANFRF